MLQISDMHLDSATRKTNSGKWTARCKYPHHSIRHKYHSNRLHTTSKKP